MTAPATIQNETTARRGRRPQNFTVIVFAPVSKSVNPRKNVAETLMQVAQETNGTLRGRRGRGAVVPMPKAGDGRGRNPTSEARTFVATFRSTGSLEAFIARADAEVTGLRFGETEVTDA